MWEVREQLRLYTGVSSSTLLTTTMEAPMGAVRDLLSREGRKAVGVRVPLLPPMDARKGALNRLESGDC